MTVASKASTAATTMAAPSAASSESARRGAELLISASARLPAEKLRLLRSIFAQACQHLRDRLHEISGGINIDTTLRGIAVQQVAETGMAAADWLVVLCAVKNHNTLSCIGLDSGMVNLFIEAALGGGVEGSVAPGQRDWTFFDQLLASRAASEIAAAVQQAFAPTMELDIAMSEVRAGDAAEELALEERPVLAVRIGLRALEMEGEICVVLPPGIASGLQACAMVAEMPPADEQGESTWAQELDSQLRSSEITCRAVLDGGEITLREVAAMRVGQVLPLQVREDAPVRLECDGETLFHCTLGQAGGRFVLRLGQAADGSREFMESIVAKEEGEGHGRSD